MTEGPKLIEWLMLLATAAGPLVGIWVTRWIDRANDRIRRREAVFQALIRTRGLELSPEHVSNLNMVPLLFNEPAIRLAYSRIMEAVNDKGISSENEAISEPVIKRLVNARIDLIREIGKAVGTPLPEAETERYGYAPQVWADEQTEIQALRRATLAVMEGKSPLQMIAGVWQVVPEHPGQSGQVEGSPGPGVGALPPE